MPLPLLMEFISHRPSGKPNLPRIVARRLRIFLPKHHTLTLCNPHYSILKTRFQMKCTVSSCCGPIGKLARCVVIAYLMVLLMMMLLENWLVYPIPPTELGDWNPKWLSYEEVWFTSDDGTKLHGWFVPHQNARYAILYCHGNGEHIAMNADLAARLRDRLEASVFLFDYRGYGRSEGRPSETGCIADGRAAHRWLAERLGMQTADIVLMGRSLGSAVAVAVAADQGAKSLVLECAFPNMPAVASVHFPWLPVQWVMHNRYDSVSRLQRYGGPVMQTHGGGDRLVPMTLARGLFDVATHPLRRWIEFPDLDHNEPWPDNYYDELAAFLKSVEDRQPPANSG